jgi:hypothetical protein
VNAKLDDENSNESMIVAKSWNSGWNWGTKMAVWLDPVDANTTKVTILSRRNLRTTISTDLTEKEFHQKFGERLASTSH